MRLYRKNSIGMKFHKLTVIGIAERDGFVICLCECGKKCEKCLPEMKRGERKSCGCLLGEQHGKSRSKEWTKTYASWKHMKMRCRNPNDIYFRNYGGRGITVCDRWNNSFEAFVSDMGKRPEGYTLDRIDVNGSYCPENCRWATKSDQDNNRRSTLKVSVKGVEMPLKQASKLLAFNYDKARYHYKKNRIALQQWIDFRGR